MINLDHEGGDATVTAVQDAADAAAGAVSPPVEPPADPLDDLIDGWVRDVFHGTAAGRELSAESHNRILAGKDELKARLRALMRR